MGQNTSDSKLDSLQFEVTAPLVGLYVALDYSNSLLKTFGAYVDTCYQIQTYNPQ